LIVREEVRDLHGNGGLGVAHRFQEPEQKCDREVWSAGDPKCSPQTADAPSLSDGDIEAREHLPRLADEHATCIGQRNGSARAMQKRNPELLFEPPDCVRKPRLRDVQPRGRPTEVKLLADGDEVAEMAKLDRRRNRDWLGSGVRNAGRQQTDLDDRDSVLIVPCSKDI
jgi:hypothetical protein